MKIQVQFSEIQVQFNEIQVQFSENSISIQFQFSVDYAQSILDQTYGNPLLNAFPAIF